MFCNTSIPVPETCGSSVRLPYPYPEFTNPAEHNLGKLRYFLCLFHLAYNAPNICPTQLQPPSILLSTSCRFRCIDTAQQPLLAHRLESMTRMSGVGLCQWTAQWPAGTTMGFLPLRIGEKRRSAMATLTRACTGMLVDRGNTTARVTFQFHHTAIVSAAAAARRETTRREAAAV